MNNTTTDIKFPTCGTTESNDSIEIKKPFLSSKVSKILKVIIYFLGIILTFIIASVVTNLIWKNNTKEALNNAFDKGYKVGYTIGKTETTNSQETNNNISKAFQYVPKK